jgi:biopolymer transport protein ExbB/TolQ
MSTQLPPPLPDGVAIRESIRLWKSVLWVGGALAAGPVWGLLATIVGMLRTFGQMNGDISQAATSITGGVATALIGTQIGLAICPVGVLFLVLAMRRIGPLKQQLAALNANNNSNSRAL